MDPKTIPSESAVEVNGNGVAANAPGLYQDPRSGKLVLAQNEPQADAYVRVGFVWQRYLQDSDYELQAGAETDPVKNAEIAQLQAKHALELAKARASAPQPSIEDAPKVTKSQAEVQKANEQANKFNDPQAQRTAAETNPMSTDGAEEARKAVEKNDVESGSAQKEKSNK